MRFIVINGNPQRTILCQQLPDNFQAVAHQSQSDGMLQSVVVMGKGAAGVIGRVDKHAFHFAAKFLFEGFQSKQVVAVDEAVIKFKFGILAAVAA